MSHEGNDFVNEQDQERPQCMNDKEKQLLKGV